MNSNLIRYRLGRKVLVKRNDWVMEGNDNLIEVEILAKSSEGVKVIVLSEGWWGVNEILWLATSLELKKFWIAQCSTGWAD